MYSIASHLKHYADRYVEDRPPSIGQHRDDFLRAYIDGAQHCRDRADHVFCYIRRCSDVLIGAPKGPSTDPQAITRVVGFGAVGSDPRTRTLGVWEQGLAEEGGVASYALTCTKHAVVDTLGHIGGQRGKQFGYVLAEGLSVFNICLPFGRSLVVWAAAVGSDAAAMVGASMGTARWAVNTARDACHQLSSILARSSQRAPV